MAKKYSKKKRTYKTRRLYKILTRRFRGAGSPLARKPNTSTSTSTSTNPKKMTTPTPRRQSMMEEILRSNNKKNIRSIEYYIASRNAIKKEEKMKMELLKKKAEKAKEDEKNEKNEKNEENEENEENDEDENYDDLYER